MIEHEDQDSPHRVREHVSLLPQKHQDRLQRIVRKFRSGEIVKRKEVFT